MPTKLVPNLTKTGIVPHPFQVLFRRGSPHEPWKLEVTDLLAAFLAPEMETVLWAFPADEPVSTCETPRLED
jgi:hypothetical protein